MNLVIFQRNLGNYHSPYYLQILILECLTQLQLLSSFTNPTPTAEKFNKLFTNIGKSLEISVNNNNYDLLFYLKNFCLSSISLQPTSTQKF